MKNTKHKLRWTPRERGNLRRMLKKNATVSEMAKAFNRTESAIENAIARYTKGKRKYQKRNTKDVKSFKVFPLPGEGNSRFDILVKLVRQYPWLTDFLK